MGVALVYDDINTNMKALRKKAKDQADKVKVV